MLKSNNACYMCDNALINGDLSSDCDYSSFTLCSMPSRTRLMLSSGFSSPLRIEYEVFDDQYGVWRRYGVYYPKFCPNCGREVTEYKKDM